MKRINQNFAPRLVAPPVHDRQGSVIIVVITLLTALMVLGFFAFTRAQQDQQNADYFAQGSKKIEPLELNQDLIFDSFLRQLILGSAPTEYNSVFYGGHTSLLPTMFGSDFAPFSGPGVRLTWERDPGTGNFLASPQIVVDMDNDGQRDPDPATHYLEEINHSPAGVGEVSHLLFNPASPPNPSDPVRFLPQPDVPYTYPDHTSPFLTHISYVPVYNAAGNRVASQRVILPAFHRPQLLRGLGPLLNDDWYTDPSTRSRVFRPHAQHTVFDAQGIPQGLRYDVSFNVPHPNDGHWAEGPLGSQNYDADPTGRGVNDAVYIDIGFPMQTDPVTGQQYIPLVAAVILDGEALINLNVHGNSNKYNYVQPTNITNVNPFGGLSPSGETEHLSSSNWGISRSEVNPGWVMTTDTDPLNPSETTGAPNWFEQYEYLFGHRPVNRIEASNMDLWCLLHGRAIFGGGSSIPATSDEIVQLMAGRYGEIQRLDSAIASRSSGSFPWPGTTNFDDNGNAEWGNPGAAFSMANVPPFSHPLDVFGIGSAAEYTVTDRTRYMYNAGGSPLVFPQYRGMLTHAQTLWRTALGPNALMVPPPNASSTAALYGDEPDETVAEPALALLQSNDSIFRPPSIAALQLSRNDLDANNISDRVLGLAGLNFKDSDREQQIRALFGAASSDLKAYSHVYHDPFFAADPRFRTSEFESPPNAPIRFPSNSTSAIRPELNELMFMEVTGYRGNDIRKLQRKLSVNGVLDRDPRNNLRFRPLTPHPTTLAETPIGNFPGLVRPEQLANIPAAQQSAAREFLARRDRQKMARDIYTLLYLFGGADDSVNNYLTEPSPYTEEQCREMAQFAVNVVDHLDTDHNITRFEYLTDLSGGWTLDDNPYTTGDGGPERAEAFGVEEQQFCFSEILAIFARETQDGGGAAEDHSATEWEDTQDSSFLFVELENVSPRDAAIAGGWQIIVRSPDNATMPVQTRRCTLQNSADIPGGGRATIGTMNVANPNLDGMGGPGPTRFRVDPNGGSAFQDIAPRTGVTLDIDLINDPTKAIVTDDADMVVQANRLLELDGSIDDPNNDDHEDQIIEVVLLRRANLDRTPPPDNTGTESDDNPWVVADRMRVDLEIFDLGNGNGATDKQNSSTAPAPRIQEELNGANPIRSTMRYQSLYGKPDPIAVPYEPNSQFDFMTNDAALVGTPPGPMDPERFVKNTLGRRNRPIGLMDPVDPDDHNNQLWQPHFNRDYASLAELFNIPLYGPQELDLDPMDTSFDEIRELTFELGEMTGGATGHHAKLTGTSRADEGVLGTGTFGHRVLNPDPDININPPTDISNDNRWHRVLNFLEVPRRQAITGFSETVGYLRNPNTGQFEDGHQDAIYRNHGPLNPNTLRNPEVYAAMLDDDRVMQLQNFTDPATTYLEDRVRDRLVSATFNPTVPQNHDWWGNFLASRDGFDPQPTPAENHNVIVPGIPGVSRPFRPLSYSDDGQFSIEETILRSLIPGAAFDDMATDRRQFFELGNQADHTDHVIDYAEKYRLLGKAMNHSTLTSNTFYIFLQVDYFEATDLGGGAARIGAKLSNSPGYRGFFVVDRAKALDMVTPSDLPPTQDPNTGASLFSFNQNFDWRSLVLYRRRLN